MTTFSHAPSAERLPAGRVPVRPNVDPTYFEQEKAVFRNVWLNLAFEWEIPAPGDFVVKSLEMLGISILIVRSDDGAIRAFHNVCRHRGNRLVSECKGHRRAFVCNFHSWSYDTRGALRFVMDEADFDGLNKKDLGLVPVNAGTWNGLIFVNLSDQPAESLGSFLEPLNARLGMFDLASMRRYGKYTAKVQANWKTVQDAFIEAYHVRTVHARSLPNLRRHWLPRDTGALGNHTTMTAFHKIESDPSPTEAIVWKTC